MRNIMNIKVRLRNKLEFADYVMLQEMMKMDIECKRMADGLLNEYEKAHSEWNAYVKSDVESLYPKIPTSSFYGFFGNHNNIGKVIFNNPATIIMWRDGSKTVVKCQPGDVYDPEKGFVMAYLKKLLGNDNTFNKEIARWVK